LFYLFLIPFITKAGNIPFQESNFILIKHSSTVLLQIYILQNIWFMSLWIDTLSIVMMSYNLFLEPFWMKKKIVNCTLWSMLFTHLLIKFQSWFHVLRITWIWKALKEFSVFIIKSLFFFRSHDLSCMSSQITKSFLIIIKSLFIFFIRLLFIFDRNQISKIWWVKTFS
jgi:hypothetical protein